MARKTSDTAPESNDSSAPLSFETCLAELEQIVRELEMGELPLAASLQRYEQGVNHLRQCYQQLESAERRVELLKSVGPDGSAETMPFVDESLSLEEKAAARGKRRTAAPRSPLDRD